MTQITTGAFVNVASTPKFIPLSQKIDLFRLWNLTMSGVTALGVSGSLTSTRIVEAIFNPNYMSNGTAMIRQNGTVVGILAPLNNGVAAINGFTVINASTQLPGPSVVVNSFVPGTTTVWTTNTPHGFLVGDIVRVTSLTSAPELGGLSMTVTAVGSTTTFTTLLNSSNSLTSVGVVQKVGNVNLPMRALYYPEVRVIAAITKANPMVVTTLVQQNYQVGDVVRFAIPTQFGMQQLNTPNSGLPFQATVSAVNNAVGTQTLTFANVDSTNFTAFAFPGTGFFPTSFPYLIPQGEGNLNNLNNIVPSPLPYGNQDILGFARQNQGANGILIGAGDGTNSATTGGIIGSTVDAWMWEAVTSLQTFP
jgi:hypothetical protein